jgi:hypothetical protein
MVYYYCYAHDNTSVSLLRIMEPFVKTTAHNSQVIIKPQISSYHEHSHIQLKMKFHHLKA